MRPQQDLHLNPFSQKRHSSLYKRSDFIEKVLSLLIYCACIATWYWFSYRVRFRLFLHY